MPIISKGGTSGEGFEPCPEGTHLARCITVIDCGTQKSTYNGEDKWQEKVWIAFEIPAIRVKWTDKDDNEKEGPALVGQMYTNSIWERATLGQHLVGWRGKSFTSNEQKDGFDISVLLDKPAQISISHKPKKDGNGVFVNIVGIMGLPPGMEPAPREMDLTLYDPKAAEAPAVFDKLPKWLKEKVTFGHRLDQQDSRTTSPPVSHAANVGNPGGPLPGHMMPNTEAGDPGIQSEGDFDDDIPF